MIDWDYFKQSKPPRVNEAEQDEMLAWLLPPDRRQRIARHAYGDCPLCGASNTFGVDLCSEEYDARCKACGVAGPIAHIYDLWWHKQEGDNQEVKCEQRER